MGKRATWVYGQQDAHAVQVQRVNGHATTSRRLQSRCPRFQRSYTQPQSRQRVRIWIQAIKAKKGQGDHELKIPCGFALLSQFAFAESLHVILSFRDSTLFSSEQHHYIPFFLSTLLYLSQHAVEHYLDSSISSFMKAQKLADPFTSAMSPHRLVLSLC
jgi:hypothetical protein